MSDQAPFIPGADEEDAIPEEPWRVFGTGSFFRLWLSQVLSSLGDWIGLLAILALANTVSKSNAAALSLVMVARMLPGFLLAPLCGALVDRLDRKRVMVVTDLARAVLLALLPFVDTLARPRARLLRARAVRACSAGRRPPPPSRNLVPAENLPQANSLSLVAAFGTFPAGALIFASLAGLADWLSGFNALDFLKLDRESIALYFDAVAFTASALITMTLPIPRTRRGESGQRIKVTQTLRDIKEGVQFIAGNELVRGVIFGLAGGLLGGGMIIPLGPVFSDRVLDRGHVGLRAAHVRARVRRRHRCHHASCCSRSGRRSRRCSGWPIVATGGGIMAAASFSALVAAMFVTVFVGAAAGTGYVAGFTLLQRHSHDEVRGRTFAALYTLIRVCLLFSLTVTPLLAGALDELSKALFDNAVIEVGGQAIGLPGVRLALWLGGSIALASGFVARREMIQAHRREAERA